MKLLFASMVTAVMSAWVNASLTQTDPWMRWTTEGSRGRNLNGKMFTLSVTGGRISFYSPSFYPTPTFWPSPTPYLTRIPTTTKAPYTTTTTTRPTTTYPPWTTASPPRGVSVCLRYLIDTQTQSNPTIFTLSPQGRSLRLLDSGYGGYTVYFDGYSYNSMFLRPVIKFWPYIGLDIWTRVCLIVDTTKRVAQVFNGSSGSIRKLLPRQYVWSGEPEIDFSGFDGQVTDVQVWDYPLSYSKVLDYMGGSSYWSYAGSVLSWSFISYTSDGNVLLEDNYQRLAKQPISSRGRGRRPKEEKRPSKIFIMKKQKGKERQQL